MKNRGKSKVLFGFFISLFSEQIQAEDISLMLTPAQQKSLNGALYAAGNSGLIKTDVIFLQAILYLDEQQWVIWVNDQRIDPQSALVGIDIHQVMPDKVLLSFEEGAPVTLKVNQSYLATGRVKEGDQRYTHLPNDTVSSHNNSTDEPD